MILNNDKLIEFLSSIVASTSLSGEEQNAIDLVAAEMRRLGFDEVRVDENGSLTGAIHGSRPGPTLLLDAHIDTVGVAAGVEWQYEPYAATPNK